MRFFLQWMKILGPRNRMSLILRLIRSLYFRSANGGNNCIGHEEFA